MSARRIVDRHADHRRSVFVAGASKNSTGVICDALNYARRYRYLFEPFSHVDSTATGVEERLLWTEYVSPADGSSALRHYARRILTGRMESPHVDRWTFPGVYERRLISESRLNLWLKWLHVNFDGMPMILVMRHPCAAVSARLLLERPTRFNRIIQNEDLIGRHLTPFKSIIRTAKSPVERHAVIWAIEHYVPLHEFANDHLHVILYERFLSEPRAELERASAYLGERPSSDVPPSIPFHERTAVLDAWRKQLSTDDARRIMEIVAAFGLDSHYPIETAMEPSQPAMNHSAYRMDQKSTAPPPTTAQIDAIISELNGNVMALERYIATLELLLYQLCDGHQWQMHDWDWIWPRHEPLQVTAVAWARARGTRAPFDQPLHVAIENAYEAFRSMPPPLDDWAREWDGQANTFLEYMQAKLEGARSVSRSRAQTAVAQLSGQLTT